MRAPAEYTTTSFGTKGHVPKESTIHYVGNAEDEGSHNSMCSKGTRLCCLESRLVINVGGHIRDYEELTG